MFDVAHCLKHNVPVRQIYAAMGRPASGVIRNAREKGVKADPAKLLAEIPASITGKDYMAWAEVINRIATLENVL